MRFYALILLLLSMTVLGATAQPYADASYRAPGDPKALAAALHAVPPTALEQMLREPVPHQIFEVYAGRNADLEAASEDSQPLEVAAGFATDLTSDSLFGQARPSKAHGVEYLAAIASVDAVALRLQVDLSSLRPGEELFVIDPMGPRAFGPYTVDDALVGGRWLPTIEGETAVLLARVPDGPAPALRLTGVSHFYRQLEDLKVLGCNINAACLTAPLLQDASSGVGMIVRTTVSGDSAVCSGTLINNPDTAELEPYYITANHCIPGAVGVHQADIIWDFRTAQCGTNTPPALASLPRSDVVEILATDSALDVTLLRLDTVPGGIYGRTYVGWDTRTPLINENVVGIHHPDGSHMRVSFGRVTALNQPAFGSLPYVKQIEVRWDEGVTEGGSSGSCLLFENDARLIGTLSNGPAHSCFDTSRNRDRYGSFRDFYPQVTQYLGGGVIGGPVIQVSEASHSFGDTPEPWTFQVWNGDSASTLNFVITGAPAWVMLSRTTGQSTGPDDRVPVTVTVDTSQLASGSNTATLQISGSGASPRTIVLTAWGAKAGGCNAAAPGNGRIIWSDVILVTASMVVLLCVSYRKRLS
jgi:hypothetical protein